MLTLQLALRSLRNRRLTTILTVLSIALSVALLVGVETVRRGIRESFAGTIRGTDLIVGARGGSQQLLLSSIFGLGSPAGSIEWSTYQKWSRHPAVKWTIPISLGDSYYGYRVVGTTSAFFEHYKFRNDGRVTAAEGRLLEGDKDVVVGIEVAKARKLSLGSEVTLTHGLRGTGISDHEEHPFTVVGILARTSTPIDRSVFITLEGIEGMHEGMPAESPDGWAQPKFAPLQRPGSSAPPPSPAATPAITSMPGAEPPPPSPVAQAMPGADAHADHGHKLTAFLLGAKARAASLMLQRQMNTDRVEPLTAILPAVALTELWRSIGYAEDGARIITGAVLLVGLLGMLVALYSTLQERRREMAILRSLGAGPGRIAALLVLESGLLAFLGAVVGLVLVYGLLFVGQGLAETHFGVYIPITAPQTLEWFYLGGVVVAGILVGLIPAWRAYRNTLQDGLTIRL
ncbi:MAG: FtsX-like permease family protein [Gemmatimonadales bacterium]|nr:FtsX-like permease family protein [Gemmatimonadales bacterium]